MKKLNKFILVLPLILAIAGVSALLLKTSAKEENVITGIVESADVDVASKIAGRIDSVLVDEGTFVQKGQVLAIIQSKEMDAKVGQVKAAMDAAKSRYEMALKGARPEEKEALQKLYNQAKYQYELADKTYKRFQNLYRDSLVSMQEKDQVEFQYKAAMEQMLAANAKYQMALNGARPEEKEGAAALFLQSQNAVKEVNAYHDELTVVAPISGEITKKIVDAGEVIASGYPIFNITPVGDDWVTIQVREDNMGAFQMGKTFFGTIPALSNIKAQFKVVFISPVGEFANWKPTNQKGEFDLKTFEIHLKPVENVKGLRPGMSVNISI